MSITTCLPFFIASVATFAPTSGTPVQSITASTPSAAETKAASPHATYLPAAIPAFASSRDFATTISSSVTSAYLKACTARETLISDTIAGVIPFMRTICVTIPRPICPAPTIPTLMIFPSFSLCSSFQFMLSIIGYSSLVVICFYL